MDISMPKNRIYKYLAVLLCLLVLAAGAAAVYFGGLHNLAAAIYTRIFGVMPVTLLGDGTGVPVLMYHHLAPEGTYAGTDNEKNAAIISVEDFSVQMEYLAQHGYQTVFLSELVELLQRGEELPQQTVVLTFDDGYESVYVYAFPILSKYGFKADVALIGASANKPAPVQYDPRVLSSLSAAQIAEMQQSGLFEFESHTYDLHQIVPISSRGVFGYAGVERIYLTEHSRRESADERAERLRADFVRQEELLQGLGINATVLLYPYGETDRELIAAAKEAGMQAGFTVRIGFVTQGCDIFRLPRLTISQLDSMESFERKLRVGK